MVDEITGLKEAQAEFFRQMNSIETPKEMEHTAQPAQIQQVQNEQPQTQMQQETQDAITGRKFSSYTFAEFCANNEPIKYFIKGYIQANALEMIFGKPGSAKSFIAIDMAASIACPEIDSWHGKKLKHANVIYLAGEGVAGLRQRFAGWAFKRRINPGNVQLKIIDETFALDECAFNPTSECTKDNIIANLQALYPNPGLIVIDTLNCHMAGDENRAVDVGRYISICREIIKKLGCTVLLVHHTGVSKEAQDRARGSSALRGAMDIELSVDKSDKIITLEQQKNKEGEIQPAIYFNLERMEVPGRYDEDGEQVTTCTIELNTTLKGSTQSEKIGKDEKLARETFEKAVEQFGQKIEHGIVGVYIEDWRKIFYESSSADKESTKRGTFNRGRKALLEDKHILTKKNISGNEYYCLDKESTVEHDYKERVFMALQRKQERQEKTDSN